ncbi:MAG: alternative ribosome rescue aminoacyl-tRNA hydrolase ArfB [Flavobacteriales bacterium]|jgi:ribosome-associated protein|tara:strand:+ start:742 stop:1146 length:405 start_codon:yes stop_codon:yes gene_type:complete
MDAKLLINEFVFKAIRSSGPGGQHVNKTSSKIALSFHIHHSNGLEEYEKERLLKKLATKLSSDGYVKLSCSDTRSQHQNKVIVIDRMLKLLQLNLKIKTPRKKTKPSRSSIEKRIQTKKKNTFKKLNRKPPKMN